MFHRLSDEDVYTRFFRRVRSLSYPELQTLCNVNHETDVAFLGVIGPRENEKIIGSACYFLNPTTNIAEVAFMVAPEFQGAGLGTALQARLQEEPRRARVCLRDLAAQHQHAAARRTRTRHNDNLA